MCVPVRVTIGPLACVSPLSSARIRARGTTQGTAPRGAQRLWEGGTPCRAGDTPRTALPRPPARVRVGVAVVCVGERAAHCPLRTVAQREAKMFKKCKSLIQRA